MKSRFTPEELAERWNRFNSPLNPPKKPAPTGWIAPSRSLKIELVDHPTQGIHGFTDN
jgi:hypothetical protein